jgi:N-acetylmuramoyl-L-alanine amidase
VAERSLPDRLPRPPGARRRAILLAVLGVQALAGAASAAVERARLPGGEVAALVDKRELFLEAPPRAGEGLYAFSRRLTGGTGAVAEIGRLNGKPKRLLAGRRYRVPFGLLAPEWKLASTRALFPDDRATADGWLHRSRGEDLARIAEWFTGRADRVAALRSANRDKGDKTRRGQEVRIPNDIALPIFRWASPLPSPKPTPVPTSASTVPAPSPRPALPVTTPDPRAAPPVATATPLAVPPLAPAGSGSEPALAGTAAPPPVAIVAPVAPAQPGEAAAGLLDYAADERGKFAIYRLRPGEALYSAVIVRFTGRTHADDVNGLATEVAARSGIVDVSDIPIGFPVKIAFELLLPDFLPVGDPRRLEWEVERRLSDQFKNEVRAKGLEGVTVILDAGHGGSDVGASMAGVWESLYVYDVMLRVKRMLETETHARVHTTTRDGAAYAIVDRDVLPFSRGHRVLTRPPYAIGDANIGVHLRWYLANSLLKRETAKGGDNRVVFVSVHADSLHPSLRGATAYIPGAALTGGSFGRSGSAFTQREEVRERPKVSFSLRERQRSEGLSRDLAEHVVAAFRRADLAVHPFQPVREKIFRGRRAWVPAVLRYNAVPAKFLLEVCNIANKEDRRLLQTRAFRHNVAAAVVAGLRAYFGAPETPAGRP